MQVARRGADSPWWLVGLRLTVVVLVLAQVRPGLAQSGGFAFGQQVEAHGPGVAINLRRTPGFSGHIVTTLPNGTSLTVVAGPVLVDDVKWWKLDSPAAWGWASESLLRPVADHAGRRAPAGRVGCVVTGQAYSGLYHCLRPGDVHVVVIDLNDPHVRFETVMAYDATDVKDPRTEWVSHMAERYPGAAAAINGDYFTADHSGPEGLTLKNGQRLDRLTTMEHSALVIGQAPLDRPGSPLPIPAQIARLAAVAGPLDPATFYNAVGGGPQVVFDSLWRWSSGFDDPGFRGCQQPVAPQVVINGECLPHSEDWLDPQRLWTVVGLTGDHKMIWVVGPYSRLRETLAAFQVTTAIKLDSSGSSQLWYSRRLVQGYRPVANGLLAFYLRSGRITPQPQWAVALENEPQTWTFSLENTGADTWHAGETVLQGEGAAGQSPVQVALPQDVAPGATVTVKWTGGAAACGWVDSTWHLARAGQAFPDRPVHVSSLVLPRALAGMRGQLQGQIDAWLLANPGSGQPPFLAYWRDVLARFCPP